LDLDFSNILAYPPAKFAGIVVLRLPNQAHTTVVAAIQRVLALLPEEAIEGMLWIVEERRIRIRG
jgi:hypothetical protein